MTKHVFCTGWRFRRRILSKEEVERVPSCCGQANESCLMNNRRESRMVRRRRWHSNGRVFLEKECCMIHLSIVLGGSICNHARWTTILLIKEWEAKVEQGEVKEDYFKHCNVNSNVGGNENVTVEFLLYQFPLSALCPVLNHLIKLVINTDVIERG